MTKKFEINAILNAVNDISKIEKKKSRIVEKIGSMDKERSIIRSHAVSASTELLSAMAKSGAEVQIASDSVIDLARKIEYYTSGDDVKELMDS